MISFSSGFFVFLFFNLLMIIISCEFWISVKWLETQSLAVPLSRSMFH